MKPGSPWVLSNTGSDCLSADEAEEEEALCLVKPPNEWSYSMTEYWQR